MRRAHKPATRRSECPEIGCPLPGTIEDQELLLDENGLGDNGTDAARTQESGKSSDDMDEKDDEIAHLLHHSKTWNRKGLSRELAIRQRHLPD